MKNLLQVQVLEFISFYLNLSNIQEHLVPHLYSSLSQAMKPLVEGKLEKNVGVSKNNNNVQDPDE
jgi:hypothetical protein